MLFFLFLACLFHLGCSEPSSNATLNAVIPLATWQLLFGQSIPLVIDFFTMAPIQEVVLLEYESGLVDVSFFLSNVSVTTADMRSSSCSLDEPFIYFYIFGGDMSVDADFDFCLDIGLTKLCDSGSLHLEPDLFAQGSIGILANHSNLTLLIPSPQIIMNKCPGSLGSSFLDLVIGSIQPFFSGLDVDLNWLLKTLYYKSIQTSVEFNLEFSLPFLPEYKLLLEAQSSPFDQKHSLVVLSFNGTISKETEPQRDPNENPKRNQAKKENPFRDGFLFEMSPSLSMFNVFIESELLESFFQRAFGLNDPFTLKSQRAFEPTGFIFEEPGESSTSKTRVGFEFMATHQGGDTENKGKVSLEFSFLPKMELVEVEKQQKIRLSLYQMEKEVHEENKGTLSAEEKQEITERVEGVLAQMKMEAFSIPDCFHFEFFEFKRLSGVWGIQFDLSIVPTQELINWLIN